MNIPSLSLAFCLKKNFSFHPSGKREIRSGVGKKPGSCGNIIISLIIGNIFYAVAYFDYINAFRTENESIAIGNKNMWSGGKRIVNPQFNGRGLIGNVKNNQFASPLAGHIQIISRNRDISRSQSIRRDKMV